MLTDLDPYIQPIFATIWFNMFSIVSVCYLDYLALAKEDTDFLVVGIRQEDFLMVSVPRSPWLGANAKPPEEHGVPTGKAQILVLKGSVEGEIHFAFTYIIIDPLDPF